ncbi:DUF992 domain-containing protein [Bartonella tamiae]|uniref:DUF992 domain-containing protein n=1 Tax=Bartonella tamiae Th239 TaxID=1094558 RepID=J0QT37_9HYPH|nr:DUF992 domain-containing protein [Bartonella tamiae]EJF89036.1 hypothetical protein ME5_01587 [Bartonella tamiae Th239]EJF94714.1 hypothetical protein MEG_00295 [Bartonella tamiae Th307]
MSHMLKTAFIAGLTTVTALFSTSNIFAADKVTVGMLVCTGQGKTGQIFKSSEELSCIYQPNNKGAQADHYKGKIEEFGLDVGQTGAGQISWLVLAASKDAYSKGVLSGEYGGVGVNAAAGVGAGARILVGNNKAFSLQPVSVEAHEGANLALGVSKLTLRAK